jgi:peptidoglycan/LPS O-acetylase OafA/YrhL
VTHPTRRDASPVRGDIEGLRAIAVVMVLLYHARLPGISGGFAGVDVFFVISGFLITSLLLREVQRSGRISLTGFYARRARRLLPAATVVLLFTGAVGYLVLPAGPRGQLGENILASTFYVVNWSLAAQSVDYLAEDSAPSAVQHYWSLSVEEQFYLVWPLVMIAAVWLAARSGGDRFRSMRLVLAAVTAASLAWSVLRTASSPETAYFVTTTRVWELGFGALLAFGVVRLRGLKRLPAEIAAAVGVAAIALTALVISTQTPWPGVAAVLPVAGTTLVIAAGCASTQTVTGRILGLPPFRFLGRISYSLYLWHWPLLVFTEQLRPGTGLRGRLAVVALAVVLAYASTVLIEDPIRFSRPLAAHRLRALGMGAGAMACSAAVAVAMVVTTPVLRSDIPTWAVGASALMADPGAQPPELREDPSAAATRDGKVYPDPELAPEDVPALYDDGCQGAIDSAEVVTCDYGDTDSDTVVAVAGDSKIAQWLPALDRVGQQQGWRVRTYTKSACAFTAAELSIEGKPYDTCTDWNAEVIQTLTGPDRPWLVLTSAGRETAPSQGSTDGTTSLSNGYLSHWERLEEAGVGVVVLADNLHPGMQVYTCVADHPTDFHACGFPAGPGKGTAALEAAADAAEGVQMVDLSSWLCPRGTCPAVIGHVLVYRQGSHITASYVETLTPVLSAALVPAAASASQSAQR